MTNEDRDQIVDLPNGISLQMRVLPSLSARDDRKLAVLLHPWSWLGGSMHDPVLQSLSSVFRQNGYQVVLFNSRGVGGSKGWPSLTGEREGQDLAQLVEWLLQMHSTVREVTLLGYSHGSLIASLHPLLSGVNVRHAFISYPLSPRGWLTMFTGKRYDKAMVDLVQEPKSDVLVAFSDRDEFTAVCKYLTWSQDLRARSRGRFDICQVDGDGHFWRKYIEQLELHVEQWLQNRTTV